MDRLTGYRASEDEDLAPGERMLVQLRQQSAHLITLIERSEAMRAWLETPPGKAWQANIEERLSKAMAVLLTVATLDCDEARTAHFNAHVAVQSFKAMEEIINTGPELSQTVKAASDQANAELSHG